MKKISGLDSAIKDYRGNVVNIGSASGEPLLLCDVLLNIIGSAKQDNGRDVLIVHKAGIKIAEVKGDEVELEDYEFTLVKKAVENNQIYSTLVMAQVLLALGEDKATA